MCLEPKMQQVKYERNQLANSHIKFRGFKKKHGTCEKIEKTTSKLLYKVLRDLKGRSKARMKHFKGKITEVVHL